MTESTLPEAFTGTRGALEGIPQPRLCRGLEGRGGGLPRALRALEMTRVFARSAGALLMVRWVGNRKGRPSGKYG